MWQQLKIQLHSEDTSYFEQILFDSDAISISYLDAEDQPVFQEKPGSTPLWDNTFLLCLFFLPVFYPLEFPCQLYRVYSSHTHYYLLQKIHIRLFVIPYSP